EVLASRPEGSAIEVREAPDGLRLSWRPPEPECGRSAVSGVLVGFLLFWGVGTAATGWQIVGQARAGQAPDTTLLAWFVGWTVFGLVLLRFLLNVNRRLPPERLLLGWDRLIYNPGWTARS